MSTKMKKVTAKVIVFLIVLTLVLSTVLPAFAAETTNTAIDTTTKQAMTLEQAGEQLDFLNLIMDYIKSDYVTEVSYEDLVNGAYKGVFDTLDPYSVYFPATDNSYDSFQQTVQGEYEGIGITMESYNNQTRIVNIFPDTPAEKAGLKAGDIITEVDGIKITDFNQVAQKVKGKAGTSVTLTVQRDGKPITVTATRAKVKLASVTYEMKTDKIGYIRLVDFDNDGHEEFKAALEALKAKGATSIILDLRNNGGGIIDTCVKIAEQIIPAGKELLHFSKKGAVTETYKSNGTSLGMPLAVLVNKNSASASEILAGAIKDNKAGTIIGDKTFGKGIAQTSLDLKNGGAIKLTITSFITPNKTTIQGIGIQPDVTVSLPDATAVATAKTKIASFAPMSEATIAKSGSAGLNVYGAQQRLQYLGYTKAAVNGTMDANTVAIVKEFQKSAKIAVDGTLNKATRDAITKAVAAKLASIEKTAGTDTQLSKALELLK